MKEIIKSLAWVAGIGSAFVLFAEPTAALFPAQLMAGAVICGIFYFVKRQRGIYEN